MTDKLDELVPGDMDKYWELTLDFLKIAREHWPAVLSERGAIDPAQLGNRCAAPAGC